MTHHVDSNNEADVNLYFQSQTIDQLWVTLSEKRKEAELMQKNLRQLVGDRYKDLLSASDMIVGMGDICDYLIESFEETKADRREQAGKWGGVRFAGDEELDTHKKRVNLRDEARYAGSCVNQMRSWLEEGRYLEVALTARSLQHSLDVLDEANEGRSDNYLGRQIAKMRQEACKIRVSDNIIAHATESLSATQTATSPHASHLVSICLQTICCVALLHQISLHAALNRFLRHQHELLSNLAASAESSLSTEAALTAASTLYSVRSFLYKVFVERNVSVSDAVDLTPISTVPTSMLSNKLVMDLAQYIPSSLYFDARDIDDIPQDLPPLVDVKRLLSDWQTETAPLVVLIVQRALAAPTSLEAVIAVKKQLDKQINLWSNEPVQARPPDAWADQFLDAFKQRLFALLKSELSHFVESADKGMTSYRHEDKDLAEAPEIEGSTIGDRYKCAGGGRDQSLELSDPSVPPALRQVVHKFQIKFQRILDAVGMVCGHVPKVAHDDALKLFQEALAKVASQAEATAEKKPTPQSGLLVQGLSRAVAHVVFVAKRNYEWLADAPQLLQILQKRLHDSYLKAFEPWERDVATVFEEDMRRGLFEEAYWGPDRGAYERTTWSSWEHRETHGDDEGSIVSNLPSSPSAALLAALQRCCSAVTKVIPSLLRKDVISRLHAKLISSVFPLYHQLLRNGTSSSPNSEPFICQPALWQLLFDFKYLSLVCKASPTTPLFNEVVGLLTDPETGIDPVYWSTEKDLFEGLFASCVEATCLLLAPLGLRKAAASGKTASREASFVDFIPECERFATLHLAPLQRHATGLAYSSPAATSTFAGSAFSVQNASAPAASTTAAQPLQGLQHLQAFGSGLQQQLKGMKYFNWT